MKYNVAKNAMVTTSGTVAITANGINALLNYSQTPIITLSKSLSDVLVLDCDLGFRVDIYSINYNFRCTADPETTVSGIKFYYRNESFGDYVLLNTCFSGTENFFYTSVSGALFAPRYIRVTTVMTSISGTTVTGTVHGFEVLNEDSIIGFGMDGTTTEEHFYLNKADIEEVRAVPIYNNSAHIVDAIINIEPSFNNIDQVISISNNIGGPWTYIFDENLNITNPDIFNEGVFNNTESIDGSLQTLGILDKDNKFVSQFASGTYTTKVFDCAAEHLPVILNKNISSLGGKIAVGVDDVVDTVELRSSKSCPAPYSVYRTLYEYYPGTGTTSYCAFKDYWQTNDLPKKTSTYYFFSFSYYRNVMDYYITVDSETGRWAGFVHTASSSTGSVGEWRLFNNVKESSTVNKIMATHTSSGKELLFKWSEVILDSTGGTWLHFLATSYSVTDFVDKTGYYLVYLDSALTERFKYHSDIAFIQDMSINYTEGFVWYTDTVLRSVLKISCYGIIIINYSDDAYTDDVGGIAALDDGSAWYFNDGSLHKIQKVEGGGTSDVLLVDSIYDVSNVKFLKLALDSDDSDALWFIEEFSVGRIFVGGVRKGQIDFKVTLDTPVRLMPVTNGCWVWCTSTEAGVNTHIIFVSKLEKKIKNNISISRASTPGVLGYGYTNKNYTNDMPLSIDDNWKNLAWNKININTYMPPDDNYQQLKITFRTQTPSERYSWLPEGTEFIKDDYFTQASGVPLNTQLWGDWTSTRNIVNVQSNRLVLPSSADPLASNAYISTIDRVLIGSNANGEFDVRIKFMFGSGSITGLLENIYLFVYAVDTNHVGDYMCANIEVGVSANAYLRIYQNSDVTQLAQNYNTGIGWQGVLRLYKGSDNVIYAQYDKAYDGTFELTINRTLASNFGTYFYVQVASSKAGSDTYIDDFQVVSGNTYYYTETPGLKSIYTLKPVIINDIYPNSSKELYIRSQVPSGLDVINQYETNLNVKWRIPVN